MGEAEESHGEVFDIIIIGAGISGINSAYRIQTELPSTNYTILEARGAIGGTWDFFKYPGFRSDSDLYTFGFLWRPWTAEKIIASGNAIRNYIEESATSEGINKRIEFHHKLISANWSSDQQLWTLSVDANEKRKLFHARFVILGTGYYDYDQALATSIPGIERFSGTVLHPQFWPETTVYADKKVVVIGSGSTAITLIPALAETASHVTMLQRSPSYTVSIPSTDAISGFLSKVLPANLVYRLNRLKALLIHYAFVKVCVWFPIWARNQIKNATIRQLPKSIPHDPHFEPRYNPWEQRLCLCPDGDFFKSMRKGKASVVTGTIMTITERAIKLDSGQEIDADVIVTATGLKLRVLGGAQLSVDNVPVDISQKYLWRNAMLEDLPNMATVIGYTNAPWTLGADATAFLICRLLKHMKGKRLASAIPTIERPESMKAIPFLNLSSTYIQRGKNAIPKAGDKAPWTPRKSYFSDIWDAQYGDVTKGMRFENLST